MSEDDFQEKWSSADDFEVEVSALDADSAADASIASPDPLEPGPASAARKRLVIGICALLVALLVLARVPTVRGQALCLFSGTPSPTPYSVSAVQISQLQPQPAQGWALAGPHYASSIVFAPSAPATGYTCGPQQPTGNQPVPVIVGATDDAGVTWRTIKTPASAAICQISVDPTNALDVALLASPCEPCLTPQTTKFYRSFDGGKHWSLWSLPPSGANQSPDLLYAQWIWVGSTLFIAPRQAGGVSYQQLAVSVAGKAFAWVSTVGLFADAPANANINGLLASSTTLYVQVGYSDCTPDSVCNWSIQSSDDGATWSAFHPLFQGQPVSLLATGGDGRTLLGQVVRDAPPDSHIYLRSTDGGATWQMLGPRPDLLIAEVMDEAPDGSIYAAFDQDPDSPTGPQGTEAAVGIYALAKGAFTWRYVGPMPLEEQFIVNWDTAGHPLALWGIVDPNNLGAGLERHQL